MNPLQAGSPIKVPIGRQNWAYRWKIVVLKILCDEPVEGVSFAWGGRSGLATAATLKDVVEPELIGEDPLQVEKLWHKLRRSDRLLGAYPKYIHGAVDVALWDIVGKVSGLPFYRLLGAYRDRVDVYPASMFLPSPDAYCEEALRYKSLNTKGYKVHPVGDPGKDVEICRKVSKAVGDDMILMADVHGSYNHEQAVKVGRQLEELDYFWFEEPFYDSDMAGYRELCRTLDIAVARMESLPSNLSPLSEYLVTGAVDIVLADVSRKSGVTGVRKVATLCESFGVNCEIHTSFCGLLNAADLHLVCATRNCRFYELTVPPDLFNFGVVDPPMPEADGQVRVPEVPGLGVQVDWDLIDRLTTARL